MIDVRMTEDELVHQLVADISNVELFLLLSYLGIEAYVQQHVAKLLADIGLVVLHESVTQLVCLFYGIGAQRLIGLLSVPRTFLAQLVQNVQQPAESLHFFFSCMHCLFYVYLFI